ncbi:MAG: ankyrin repeat domain-containing protein [Patescibacteria group bacterium]
MSIINNLINYMLANHMYSELAEIKIILGKFKADKSTRESYVLGVPSFYGLHDIVDFLISRGFAVNAINPQNGFTALHEASVGGEVKVAKLLIHNKANISICDQLGETPLDKARSFSRREIIELLTD